MTNDVCRKRAFAGVEYEGERCCRGDCRGVVTVVESWFTSRRRIGKDVGCRQMSRCLLYVGSQSVSLATR